MITRKRLVVAVLVVIALTSLGVGAFASKLTSSYSGHYWSAVYSKSYGFGSWIYVENSWKTLLSITLPSLPSNLYYQVVCDGYASLGKETTLKIAIGVDSVTEDSRTRRFYSSTTQSIELMGIHTECVYQLGGGSHTFYFLAIRYGTDTISTNYHSITVTIFTDGGLTLLSSTAEIDVAPTG